MTQFVLDNSVAMRWILASPKMADQRYAEKVLESMVKADAMVPNLWHLEAANVLLSAGSRRVLGSGEIEGFIAQLESLPIQTDPTTVTQALGRTLSLSRAYKLSSYDAAYLELSLREGLPLATLDKDLIKAAKESKAALYLID